MEATRKRSRTFEDEIHEESVFKQMADSAPVMIWVSGLDKGCFFFNQGWLAFRGRTLQQEYGNGWAEGVHQDDFDRCLRIYCDSFDQRLPFVMEYRLLRHDNQYRWILDNGVPRYDPTNPSNFLGFIGSCIDITEMRDAQDQLRKAKEEAERAFQVKSSFLALMSHELRTPLTAIIGMVDLLKNESALSQKSVSASNGEMLDVVDASAHHLLALVEDLLEVAKSDSRDFRLVPENFPLDKLIEEVINAMRPLADSKRLTLKPDIAIDEKRMWVFADRKRIKQILFNLVGNAIKFTQTGVIGVKVEHVLEKSIYRLTVSDSGSGIPPDLRPHLFQPFVQGDRNADTRQFGGTGLGLYICAPHVLVSVLAKVFGGEVHVMDNEPQGTVVRVDLPLRTGGKLPSVASVAPFDSQQSGAALANTRILVAEDNLINQKVVVKCLESAGARDIHLASDGNQAVQLARGTMDFDVILMDCQMPSKDGFAAAKEIRENPGPNRYVPIIALTALAFPEDQERCLSHGMNGYLSKPYTREQLCRTILSHLRLRGSLQM